MMRRIMVLVAAVVGGCGWPGLLADGLGPPAAEAGGRAVVMAVPEGVRRVRLRVRDGQGWRTLTIAHLTGREGTLKLRLPDGVASADLEVAASWTDPHPYEFYLGRSRFEGEVNSGPFMVLPGVLTPLGTTDGAGSPATVTAPTVEESDIWKWRGTTLYYFNQNRGLQVIEVADPAAPRLVASLRVAAAGEQMYLLGGRPHAVLLARDPAGGDGRVLVVRHDAGGLTPVGAIEVAGQIIESRLVGEMLYVVSRDQWSEPVAGGDGHVVWRSGLEVRRIDLSDPEQPLAGAALRLASDATWSFWDAQVQATPELLMIATSRYDEVRRQSVSTVHVVGIADPLAGLAVSHRVPVAGQVRNKFQLHAAGGVLAVVSQVWAGAERRRFASVETFDLTDRGQRLGALQFAGNETITAARFVGDRVYVVTVLQIDPLFVVGLADPARPVLLGELEVPGFSTHLEPFGDGGLLSVGVEGSRIAVSWFDVADPAAPALASRVYVGPEDGWSWSEANYDEKALGFFPDERLLVLPFSGTAAGGPVAGGVQLIELGARELVLRGVCEDEFQARRGRVLGDVVAAVSGRALKMLDIRDRDHPRVLATLPLAWPADLVARVGGLLVQVEQGSTGAWWPGAVPTPPRLHVTPAAAPDELLGTLALGGGAVAGMVAEPARGLVWVAMVDPTAAGGGDGGGFTVVAVDLREPGRPAIVGRATAKAPGLGYSMAAPAYRAGWLPGGRLVWHPAEAGGGGLPWPWLGGPIDFGGMVPAVWMPWQARGNMVYTMDVADAAAPQILAAVELAADGAVAEGAVELRGEVLYHGMSRTDSVTGPDGQAAWVTSHWLGRLGLGDPARPVRHAPVSLPAALEQVVGEGPDDVVLITAMAERFTGADGLWRDDLRLAGLAFDGVAAYLVDELVLAGMGSAQRAWSGAVVVLGLSRNAEGGQQAEFGIYQWQAAGGFAPLGTLQRPGWLQQMRISDGLLLTQGEAGIEVIDFARPGDPDPVVRGFPGVPFHGRLANVIIHQRREAYVPCGLRGVATLAFGDAFITAGPTAGPVLAPADPAAAWQVLTIQTLHADRCDAAATGELGPGDDWSFTASPAALDYAGWAAARIGGADGGVPPANEDSDGDGASNGWEFLTGTDPARAGDAVQARVVADGGRLRVRLPRNPAAGGGVRLACEWSADLGAWRTAREGADYVRDPFAPDIVLEWREPVVAGGRLFLRLRAVEDAGGGG